MIPARRYKQYKLHGGKEPRSTRHSRKQRELRRQQEAANERLRQLQHQQSSEIDNDPADNSTHPLIITTNGNDCLFSHENSYINLEHSSSTSGSESDGIPPPTEVKSKKKKTKKSATVKPGGCGTSLSDSSEFSDSDKSSNDSFHSVPSSPSSPAESIVINNDIFEHSNEVQTEDSSKNEASDSLCPCTDITAGDIMFMTLTLGFKHGLTWEAQIDILNMMGSVFGSEKIPITKYLLMKEIHCFNESDIVYHIYCDGCENYHGEKDKLSSKFKCGIENCETEVDVSKTKNFFLSLSVESQLKTFVKDEKFVDNIINYRFQRQSAPSEYSDIYDGAVYQKLFRNGGVLSSQFNLSYTFFTDGMAFGTTSNKTIWPIYLIINELPYEERAKYLVLAGLYVGAKDPNVKILLQPFVDEANKLCREGFSWEYKDENVRSYVVPLCCIADSVARPKILNLQSFSAEYGCTFCYYRSVKLKSGQRYPLNEVAPLRTDESIKQDLYQVHLRSDMAQEKDRVYRGVKGASPLMFLDKFSFDCNVVVDYMHNILLGCVKRHLEIIHDSDWKKCWIGMTDKISIDHLIDTLDGRMVLIQSCSSVYRELRSLKARSHWRASEFKSWILFYCIPCLEGYLKDKYLNHLSLLSKATYILLKKTVVYAEVQEAHTLLMLYSFYFQKYFTEENMVFNIHLLSHVSLGVLNFGPLWTHNSFLFEAQNRYLRKLSKNPNSVILEIGRKFLIYRSLPQLCSKLVSSAKALQFCQHLSGSNRLKKFYKCENSCLLIGKGKFYFFSDQEKDLIARLLPDLPMSGMSYDRMIWRRRKYCTITYCKNFKNNDSCVVLTDNRFVMIKNIFLVSSNTVVLVVEILRVSNRSCVRSEHTKVDHIRRFERSNNFPVQKSHGFHGIP